MRVFEHPNTSGDWVCPICGESRDTPVTLVGIEGTEDGRKMRAEQIHVDCLDLTIFESRGHRLIGMVVDNLNWRSLR